MTTIKHPMQDVRVHVTNGQYTGRTCKVLRILPDYGEHGFAEVEFDAPKGSKARPEHDLLPLNFLEREEASC